MDTKRKPLRDIGLVYIGAQVPEEIREKLARIAEAEERSIAYVIRRAVDRELSQAA